MKDGKRPHYWRDFFGHSAILWPGFPQRWHVQVGDCPWKPCEPAEDIEVSLFSLTSFFLRFSASCCAFFRSSLLLPETLDIARLRGVSCAASGRPRPGSSSDSEKLWSSEFSSSESELSLLLLSPPFLSWGLGAYQPMLASVCKSPPSHITHALGFFILNRRKGPLADRLAPSSEGEVSLGSPSWSIWAKPT
jgi:hypothetical protein